MKKKIAIFAPVKNETTFTNIWFNYYSQFIPKEDIYFLDFGSDDLSYHTKIIPTNANILDAYELRSEIGRIHSLLLNIYEWVIPTDIDEFLWHPEGLDNYINRLEVETVMCHGYNVIHLPEKEPPIDLSKSILSQRSWWYRDSVYYDKTLITKKTLSWNGGLHLCEEKPELHDPDLYLIHLHKFDYEMTIKRHEKWANFDWSEQTVNNNWTWHYRLKGDKIIQEYWHTNNTEIVSIPEILKMSQPF